MAYVKPGTATNSEAIAVDGVVPPHATAVEVSKAGFGVVDPYTGTFEVLDALPLGRQNIQLSVEAGSATAPTVVNFATEDFLTNAEIGASAGKIKATYESSDLT